METLGRRPRNPFTSTLGRTPPVVVGREQYVGDFEQALYDGPGAHERISIVTGPRGIGKTVLLNELEDVAKSQAWHVISETTTEGFTSRIRDSVLRLMDRNFDVQDRKLSGLTLPFNTGATWEYTSVHQPTPTLRSVMEDFFELQEERDRERRQAPTGLLITLDELHYAHMQDVIEFGTTIQHLVREGREIAVAMAGIPSAVKPLLAANEGKNPVTFLRRANRIEIGLVTPDEVDRALREPVEAAGWAWTDEALAAARVATGGYPFMIQLVGQYAFRNSQGGVIEADAVEKGVGDARRRLGELVHEPSLADLSHVDRTFLIAMAQDDGPSRIAVIAERLGVDGQYAGTYRRRLIDAEMIQTAGHGLIDFELPYMREYLRSHPASDAMEQFSMWPEGDD